MCALALVLPGLAAADHDNDRRTDRGRYVYARVIKVQPIIRYVTVKVPVRECWDERRYRSRYRSAYPDRGGSTIVGAIIGGVVGHQFGSGHGNDAATVVGTMIGATIGNRSAYRRHPGTYGAVQYSRPIKRCKTQYREHQEERIDGYDVLYRYNGQRYSTRMPHDPGHKIRVRVDVRPAG